MIYCFDLDNTLCETRGGDYENSTPIHSRISIVNRLFESGHEIIIETARGSLTGEDWSNLTSQQLKKWGVKYNVLRTGVKIYADFYIDDKGIKDEDFFKKE